MKKRLSVSGKLKYLMITAVSIMILFIAGIYFFQTWFNLPLEIKNIDIDSTALMKLEQLEQISKKNGITQWALKASSAKLLSDENKALLSDVFVTFYTKDNEIITLSSKNGELDTQTHDMSFHDTVIVRYENAVLETQTLHYHKKEHIIYTQTRIIIHNEDSFVEADAMKTELDTRTIVFEGNINGMFGGKFDIL